MPKYSVTIAQDTFLLREAKRLGTDEADALRILIEVAMAREPKQHCASPSSVSQIFYPVPHPIATAALRRGWSSRPVEMMVLVWQRSFFRSVLPKRTASRLIYIDRIKSRLDNYEYARWSAGEAIAIRDFDHSRKVGEGLADAIREWEASSAKLAKAT
jgi:hypothetical protein